MFIYKNNKKVTSNNAKEGKKGVKDMTKKFTKQKFSPENTILLTS